MYYGRQATGLYSPEDENAMRWSGSTFGAHTAERMSQMRKKVEEQEAAASAEHQRDMARARFQEDHERGLQAAEQQRRMYDSQTQREGQAQRNSVLSGLLNGGGGMGGMGGGLIASRTYGDVPASQRRRRV